MQPGQEIRLNKFLAERLGISRRQADDLIAAGKIEISNGGDRNSDDGTDNNDGNSDSGRNNDGDKSAEGHSSIKKQAVLGQRIDKNDKVWYNGKIVPFLKEFTYLAFNKPIGYVCSRKKQGDAPTIYELLPEKYQKLKTVGRLDKDSSGIILLTDDGDFAFQMTHPKFIKEKIYEVTLDRALEPLHQQMIADFGVELPDGKSKLGLKKRDEGRRDWEVFMHEGRNRQIRRTFAALGYKVVKLHRIQFGKYRLDGLEPGELTKIA